jgi:hypothetical protein
LKGKTGSIATTLPQQFSEFPHLASTAVSKEPGAVLVPAVEMAKANPMRVAAVRVEVDGALFGAVDIAAGVVFHSGIIS